MRNVFIIRVNILLLGNSGVYKLELNPVKPGITVVSNELCKFVLSWLDDSAKKKFGLLLLLRLLSLFKLFLHILLDFGQNV